MGEQIVRYMHDLTIYHDLITSLRGNVKNIDKISIVKDLETNNKIKELKAEKIYELELLQEELRIRTLGDRVFGKLKKTEEETDLR